MNPSTGQILDAVQRCAAESVIVLPNNKNIVPVAKQVPDLADRPVAVVATERGRRGARRARGVRRHASMDDNHSAMTEAAGRVREARSRRRCATARPSAGPSPRRLDRHHALRHPRGGEVGRRRRDRAARRADRRRRRAGQIIVGADADAADTARTREHLVRRTRRRARAAPAVTSRSTRTSSASSSAWRLAGLTGADSPSRELAAHGVTELQGGRRQARDRAGRDGHRRPCSTCSSTTRAATSTAPSGPRSHELSIGDEATVDAEVRSIYAASHARRQAHDRRTLPCTTAPASSRSCSSTRRGANGSSRPARRFRSSARSSGYRGKRQMTNPVVDVLAGARLRASATPTRHDRAGVSAVGEGRGAHLAAAARGGVVRSSAPRRGASPTRSTLRCAPTTTWSTADARTTTSTGPTT